MKNSAGRSLRTRSSPPTSDGRHIEVAANIGGLKDAGEVAQLGGDGVGLLRSSLHGARVAPSEEDNSRNKRRSHRWSAGNNSHHPHPMSAATSRSPICQFRRRTIRSWASGEFASDSTGLKSSHATSRTPPRIGIRQGLDHVPDDRHGCRAAIQRQSSPKKRIHWESHRCRAASWWKFRPSL